MEQNFDGGVFMQTDDFLKTSMNSINSSSIGSTDVIHYFDDVKNSLFTNEDIMSNLFTNVSLISEDSVFSYYYFLDESSDIYKTAESTADLLELLLFVFIPLTICMGFLGNLLIITVVAKRRNWNSTMAVYFCSLAVADLLTCCIGLSIKMLVFTNLLPYTYSTLDCQMRMVVPIASHFVSEWQLVAISTERAVSVIAPHNVKIFCPARTAKLVTAFIWTAGFVFAVLSGVMLHARSFRDSGLLYCVVFDEYESFYNIYVFVYTSILFLIPLMMILISTIIIVSVMMETKVTNSKTESGSVTVALIIVNVFFVLTQGPFHVHFLLSRFDLHHLDIIQSNLMKQCFIFLSDVNTVVNFFIYFLSGSRFRNNVKSLFKSQRKLSIRTTSTT